MKNRRVYVYNDGLAWRVNDTSALKSCNSNVPPSLLHLSSIIKNGERVEYLSPCESGRRSDYDPWYLQKQLSSILGLSWQGSFPQVASANSSPSPYRALSSDATWCFLGSVFSFHWCTYPPQQRWCDDIGTALLEFQIPSQVSRYASFMFSFLGRGICMLLFKRDDAGSGTD